jgi:DNA recombination protein RmuC
MSATEYTLLAAAVIGAAIVGLAIAVLAQGRALHRLRLLAEQARAGGDSAGETTRRHITDVERALLATLADLRAQQAEGAGALATLLANEQTRLRSALTEERDRAAQQSEAARAALEARLTDWRAAQDQKLGQMHTDQIDRAATLLTQLGAEQTRLRAVLTDERDIGAQRAEATRTLLDTKLRELRESNDAKLAQIEKTVNEQLHAAVEQQMTASFARVIDQFTAVQKAMGDVQAVTAQIGDIKRLFSNVKTRGGWGEAQVRAMLDDILPPGSYETNFKLHEGGREMVDFAVLMPMRGAAAVYLPVDAKFPVEDYERLLAAADAGDAEAERDARRGLDKAIRIQARSIAEKYIHPPVTVEFAVMYLPTDGLYAEVARIPGMIDDLGRTHRVLVLGPSLLPALLRTIQLGQVTLALEQKSDEIRKLLGATKGEMIKMDGVLDKLAKQAQGFGNTIDAARQRTRAVGRKLRTIETAEAEIAEIVADAAVIEEEEAAE